ncbi:MAG: hypothetical protein Q8P67_24685, partial [archaeon]|nr:hypothetical protein [archaeon]
AMDDSTVTNSNSPLAPELVKEEEPSQVVEVEMTQIGSESVPTPKSPFEILPNDPPHIKQYKELVLERETRRSKYVDSFLFPFIFSHFLT